jgi:hypothetical protein
MFYEVKYYQFKLPLNQRVLVPEMTNIMFREYKT